MKKFMQKYGAMVSCWLFALSFVLLGFSVATIPFKSHAADVPVAGEWVRATWNGVTKFNGNDVWSWTDPKTAITHTYCNYRQNQYELTAEQTWTGVNWSIGFTGSEIWQWNGHTYLNSSYELTAERKFTTISLTGFNESTLSSSCVWSVGEHTYYSLSGKNYEMVKEKTWTKVTFTGLNSFSGSCVWSWGDHTYYSSGSNQYELTDERTWTPVIWTNLTNFSGLNVWQLNGHIYYSDYDSLNSSSYKHYELIINNEPEPINAGNVTREYNGTAGITSTDASWFANDLTFKYEQNGVEVTAKDVGTYDVTISRDGVDDEQITLTINPKDVTCTGTLTAQSRPYDGTTDVNVSGLTLSGILAGDDVTLQIDARFASRNAKDDVTVYADLSLAGTRAGQYQLLLTQTTATANITKREVVVNGITVADKVYDGTTNATVDTGRAVFTNILNGDTLAVDVDAVFPSANARNAEYQVALTNLVLTNDGNGNYQLAATGHQPYAPAVINPVPLTITIDQKATEKGHPVAPLTASLTAGTVVAGDNLSEIYHLTCVATSTSDAGEYDIEVVTDNHNYVITPVGGTKAYQIYTGTPIVAGNMQLVYNGQTNDRIDDIKTKYSYLDGDVITVTQNDDEVSVWNAGVYQVTIRRESQFKHVTLTIDPKPITYHGTITATKKVYDGTATMDNINSTLALDDNMIETGDTAELRVNCAFTVVTAGEQRPIDVQLSLVGADIGNYTLTGDLQWTIHADIDKRPLVVNIDAKTTEQGENIAVLTATDDNNYVTALNHSAVNVYELTTVANADQPGTYDIIGRVLNPNYAVEFIGGKNAYVVTEKTVEGPETPGETENPGEETPTDPEQPGEQTPTEPEPTPGDPTEEPTEEPEQPGETPDETPEQTGNPNDQLNGNEQFNNQPQSNNVPILPIVAGTAAAVVALIAIGFTFGTINSHKKS